jgi:uncharacterized membrane protein
MEKLIDGTIIGALAGVLLSIVLIPFGVHQAEWFLALGTVVGLFVGLLLMNEEEQPDGHADGHTAVHADGHSGTPAHVAQLHDSHDSHGDHHAAPVDPEKTAKQKEREERQRAAVMRMQNSVVTVVQDHAFKKAIASAIVGAFLIMPFAILLLLLGIDKVLWWISAGAVVGAFIGLLKAVEEEQPQLASAGHDGEEAHH